MVTIPKTGLVRGVAVGNAREYSVEIIETLSRTVIVEAENEIEALMNAKKLYSSEAVVLDIENYVTYVT